MIASGAHRRVRSLRGLTEELPLSPFLFAVGIPEPWLEQAAADAANATAPAAR